LTEISVFPRDGEMIEAVRRDGRTRMNVERYPRVAVVLGRGSNPEVELHLGNIREDRVPVLRRRGGGCAVVLDPGNVIVAVALAQPGLGGIQSAFTRLSSWLIEGLDRLGVHDMRQRGVSDLALRDRKIGGACIYRSRDLLLYGTTLLVDPEPELMERYLQHPPREPDYRKGRSHRDFVGSLASSLYSSDVAAFRDKLAAALTPLP
jgi:lipoate-protein ligase A